LIPWSPARSSYVVTVDRHTAAILTEITGLDFCRALVLADSPDHAAVISGLVDEVIAGRCGEFVDPYLGATIESLMMPSDLSYRRAPELPRDLGPSWEHCPDSADAMYRLPPRERITRNPDDWAPPLDDLLSAAIAAGVLGSTVSPHLSAAAYR